MHLVIDLRFFSLESYGLAVHLKELLPHLLPHLLARDTISRLTLILDSKLNNQNLDLHYNWWEITKDPKVSLIYSDSKYYSFGEQMKFLVLLNSLKPDLTYFFNFNFPILYNRPFVYNVLDLTLVKRKGLNPKLLVMKQVLRQGLSRAKHIFFLGDQTKLEAEHFLGRKINNSSLIHNGVNQMFLDQSSAMQSKAEVIGLVFDQVQEIAKDKMLSKFGITKPYLLFVSVWKKHKNIQRLVEAFEQIQKNNNDKYQLVLVGMPDPKFPEVIEAVNSSLQTKKNNIIVTGKVSEEDLIRLQDGAEIFVFPSLSEGFGLGIIEAASRGTIVVCSNIPVFEQILGEAKLSFDPENVQEMTRTIQIALDLSELERNKIAILAYQLSQKFRWSDQATIIATSIQSMLKTI